VLIGSKVYVTGKGFDPCLGPYSPPYISVINTANPSQPIKITDPAIGQMAGAAAVAGNGELYVPNLSAGNVLEINTVNNTVTGTVPVGGNPVGVVIAGTCAAGQANFGGWCESKTCPPNATWNPVIGACSCNEKGQLIIKGQCVNACAPGEPYIINANGLQCLPLCPLACKYGCIVNTRSGRIIIPPGPINLPAGPNYHCAPAP
jgi:YVTN family beta-propeller protein